MERLVFIDETWATTNMTRRYGLSKRGKRLVASVPHGHWKTTTFIGALRADGLTAPTVFDGAINGASFLAYVEQVLVPTLKPGDIVILATNFVRAGTTCRATRSRVCAKPLRPQARNSDTCRLIRPISTRSSRCSRS